MTRFVAALAAFGLLFVASPGILSRSGSALLACAGIAVWALVTSRPRKHAFWIDWAAAGVGFALLCAWGAYVWIGVLGFVAVAVGVYVAAAGVVLRRIARRFPLALAAPAAWIGCETLRFVIEPPFAFGWMRLGTYLSDVPLLAGGARVVGVGGLGFVIASIGGGLADLVQAREWTNRALLALVPAGIVLVASLSTSAPATVDGPRVLLVQPAFEQRRKMESPRAQDLFFDSCRLTTQAIARGARAGEKPPDLVAWGETMFPLDLAEPGLLEKYERGARSVPWAKYPVGPDAIAGMAKTESAWIQGVIYGKNGSRVVERVLPPGTSFLTGAEYHGEVDGHIRRMNAILLWNADGERAGLGGKVYLVPGAEHLCGLERQGWVRTLAHDIAGYIPDLVEFDETQVLTLAGREGTSWRFGVTVCFDNAFDDPYTEPLRVGPLDFHLVCSNEAWYEKSFEYDQMIAFSRLLAIATGRSFVRATNAGITAVIGPDGGEVARLTVDGEDRMVAGALAATVPVPSARELAPVPIYARVERAVLGLWIALPLVLLALARRRSVTRAS